MRSKLISILAIVVPVILLLLMAGRKASFVAPVVLTTLLIYKYRLARGGKKLTWSETFHYIFTTRAGKNLYIIGAIWLAIIILIVIWIIAISS